MQMPPSYTKMDDSRPVLDCLMRKLPATRKYYRVSLIVPDTGIPIIQYHQANGSSKKPKKQIQFVDLLFADTKHDTNDKFAFSVYTTCKTTTFIAQDETTMNEWLAKIREYHSALYPEFKRYDAIFEANIIEKEGLAKTMNIKGLYRLALCKESLDLIPLLTATTIEQQQQQQQQQQQHQQQSTFKKPISAITSSSSSSSTTSTMSNNNNSTSSSSSSTHHDLLSKLPSSFHNFLNHHSHHKQNNHHHHLHHITHHSSSLNNPINPNTLITPHSNHHPHLPQRVPNNQRFCKRHPLLMSRTIELVFRSIRRCGHTDSNFYIESGRYSQIGQGDLWMALNKKATARQLHELLLATMKSASSVEDQYLTKAPRSRSGSSSENAHRSQLPPSSQPQLQHPLQQDQHQQLQQQQQQTSIIRSAALLFTNNKINKDIDEDSGYLPMA